MSTVKMLLKDKFDHLMNYSRTQFDILGIERYLYKFIIIIQKI